MLKNAIYQKCDLESLPNCFITRRGKRFYNITESTHKRILKLIYSSYDYYGISKRYQWGVAYKLFKQSVYGSL